MQRENIVRIVAKKNFKEMKIILNMAVEPFFCAIFDSENNNVKKITWENAKEGSQKIWDFFKAESINHKKITFLGGISGPGGFSNLRVAGTILNTLGLYFHQEIHQIRADIWAFHMIQKENKKNKTDFPENVILNSFGKGVFFKAENNSEKNIIKNLKRINISDLTIENLEKKWCISFLPENKKEIFKNNFEINLKTLELSALEILEKQKPQKVFCPDYECPPVQPLQKKKNV